MGIRTRNLDDYILPPGADCEIDQTGAVAISWFYNDGGAAAPRAPFDCQVSGFFTVTAEDVGTPTGGPATVWFAAVTDGTLPVSSVITIPITAVVGTVFPFTIDPRNHVTAGQTIFLRQGAAFTTNGLILVPTVALRRVGGRGVV